MVAQLLKKDSAVNEKRRSVTVNTRSC